MKRLLQQIPYNPTDEPVIIKMPSVSRCNGWGSSSTIGSSDFDIVDYLLTQIGFGVGLTGKPSFREIAEKLSEKRKTQNLIFILDELDSRYDLNEIIGSFWMKLSNNVESLSNNAESSSYYHFLFIIVIDDHNCFNEYEMEFFEIYDDTWCYQIPVKLPIVSRFTSQDVEKWIKNTRGGVFPDLNIKHNTKEKSEEILTNSDNGLPDRVIEYKYLSKSFAP